MTRTSGGTPRRNSVRTRTGQETAGEEARPARRRRETRPEVRVGEGEAEGDLEEGQEQGRGDKDLPDPEEGVEEGPGPLVLRRGRGCRWGWRRRGTQGADPPGAT